MKPGGVGGQNQKRPPLYGVRPSQDFSLSNIPLDIMPGIDYVNHMKYPHVTPEAVGLWYNHLSLRMIAQVFGVSAPAVKKYLNKHGIDTSKRGATYPQRCAGCGQVFFVQRKQYREQTRRYCRRKCYYDSMAGTTITVVSSPDPCLRIVGVFCCMKPEYVPYHEDGDPDNNRVDNLKVFANSGDYLRYHRLPKNERPAPVWDGSVNYG